MTKTIRIGSRGSELALWQAHYVRDILNKNDVKSEIQIIKTKGDRIQDLSFDKMEGKGFFTKEIEDALINNQIDLAVHSLKDLQTTQPEGLTIGAVSNRANPEDWLIIQPESVQKNRPLHLVENATVGTSSARRKAQLLHFRPDLRIVDIRGNVTTRINKIQTEKLDGIILAAAGATRIDVNLEKYHVFKCNPKEFVPAPAQGVLGLQIRINDLKLRTLLANLHHEITGERTNIERGVLKLLGGGCQTPLGVYCEIDSDRNFHVWAAMANRWDQAVNYVHHSSATSDNLSKTILEKLEKN
ncbi:MAG: hydroxymethylbilane synthase [Bacteroidetes bacterium]|jgi:hydroxymethylbilane synthase|nr:hydroxymethylbilane synthase [Bacteroidota bacterium]